MGSNKKDKVRVVSGRPSSEFKNSPHKKSKPKGFVDQLKSMVSGAKEATADNPNRDRRKNDRSIADRINWPGGKDKKKKGK